jgi:3-oxoacyl-[acyl-carrier protein] reductase
MSLGGKFALVTGGSRGIGLSIAKSLSKSGCRVAICSRYVEGTKSVIDDIGNGSIWGHCDVQSPDEISTFVNGLISQWGGIDILVNNAGGGGRWGADKPIEEFEEWQQVYDKNAGAAIMFTKSFLPYMKSKKWGRVITISSVHGREAGGLPWFNMAKSAEISLMKSLSLRPEYKGITFNTIAPGYINVDGKPYKSDAGNPEDVAELANFICHAPYINGSCLVIDGGESHAF